ncbi:RagB/SusD family nutrient uptake outer membrane protein [Puteibacter caeruleilacunae]|nr:RagB/SusD family nutrient uptake outer membrane protein [Puteibacter caeruleilacunae]
MKRYISLLALLVVVFTACDDDKFLTRQPTNILSEQAIWENNDMAFSLLSDLYARIPEYQTVNNSGSFGDFDEAFLSGWYGQFENTTYGYSNWRYWDYGYIREINLFIENCGKADEKLLTDKNVFLAEARAIRAIVYFEMVKRMGGVPLILEPLVYDFGGDPTYLQYPRKKEHEIYDFIISEMDEIKGTLLNNWEVKSRATKGLALAVKCRAALYAASIAKYGVNTPSVTLPGGEVGIAASKADQYYTTSLNAAKELMQDGSYDLYKKKSDLSDNFANIFLDKAKNKEVIWVRDYKLQSGSVQRWTQTNQPYSMAEEQEGGRINPSLNLVQSFEMLDNTYKSFDTEDAAGNTLYFDEPGQMFDGRDARLKGTIIIPGTFFKGKQVDIWAGYVLADGSIVTGTNFGERKTLPGKDLPQQVVGYDGPVDGLEFSAQTGFYVRKHLDPTIGSGERGTGSEVWWVRYRYGEVLLNAAEAAFELGQTTDALSYINEVRERAGFETDLTASDLTFDRIVHERKVELAFEGHQLWDMKRWRLAHKVWNGEQVELTSNIGIADEVSNRPYGLWPYKLYDPGNPNDGKYLFKQVLPSRVKQADRFRMGNYYSSISEDVISKNPKIVKNPNQN